MLVEEGPDMIAVASTENPVRFVFVNAAFSRLLHIPSASLVGRLVLLVVVVIVVIVRIV